MNQSLLAYDEEYGMTKEQYIQLFNSGTAATARECWKLIVKDTVRRTLYDEKGFVKKSPFPYEACTSDKYMTTLRDSLPPKTIYDSLMKQGGVGNNEYNYANQIYKRYDMKNLEQFNEIYNVMHAIVTSVSIGESSNRLNKETGIEIRSCSSMSQFSGVVVLLKSKDSPQLPNSYAMYELITSDIRAGLSTIRKRYAVNTSALNKEKYESMCK